MQRASRYQRRLAKEQGAASVYQALAQRREGEEREILLALARAEERHAAHWAATLHPSERRPHPPTLRALVQQEAAELGLVFRARGLPADQAERHAAALVTYGLGRVFGTTIG